MSEFSEKPHNIEPQSNYNIPQNELDDDGEPIDVDPGDIRPEDYDRVRQLGDIIEKSLIDGSVTDPVERNLLEAALPQMRENGSLRPHLAEAFSWRRQTNSHFPMGLALRAWEFAADKQFRRRFHPDEYPIKAIDPAWWEDKEVLSQLDPWEYVWDMQQNLRSSIANSSQVFKLISNRLKDRWDHAPVVVDTGVSLGDSLKKWKLHESFPFKPVQVLKAREEGEIGPHFTPDPVAQDIVSELVDQPPVVGQMIGYDIMPISHNQDDIDLVFSSTFPMGRSLLDPQGVDEFNRLGSESPADVMLLRRHIDATDPKSLVQLLGKSENGEEFLPGGKADLFTFSGVILQFPPEKLANFFSNFLPYCNEGALFLVNEWANVNSKVPGGLEIISEDWWHRGRFKTFIIDPFNLEQPPIEFCYYLNRQCEQMILTDAGREILKTGRLPQS